MLSDSEIHILSIKRLDKTHSRLTMFAIAGLFLHFTRRGRIVTSGSLGHKIDTTHLSTSLTTSVGLIEMVKNIVPALTFDKYKGSCGKIAVIGGCQEYTGAPYFAAISSLKVGGDLAHVFCSKDAAPVIKSYSPELIVHPILDNAQAVEEICKWLPKFHALVIGPGLGRDSQLLNNVKDVIKKARELDTPLVIDADGVFLLTQEPNLIKNYKKAILTPNHPEFVRLFEAVMGSPPDLEEPVLSVTKLSQSLGNVTLVYKGQNDIISDGENVLVCCGLGGPRRCGGQGDLLSGSMGTFTHWAHQAIQYKVTDHFLQTFGPTMCAAYGACLLTRECNSLAFSKFGRSTTTSDMIAEIQPAFEQLFCD